ncbi:hypothetical protein D3C86_1758490 [compost metagenome]
MHDLRGLSQVVEPICRVHPGGQLGNIRCRCIGAPQRERAASPVTDQETRQPLHRRGATTGEHPLLHHFLCVGQHPRLADIQIARMPTRRAEAKGTCLDHDHSLAGSTKAPGHGGTAGARSNHNDIGLKILLAHHSLLLEGWRITDGR